MALAPPLSFLREWERAGGCGRSWGSSPRWGGGRFGRGVFSRLVPAAAEEEGERQAANLGKARFGFSPPIHLSPDQRAVLIDPSVLFCSVLFFILESKVLGSDIFGEEKEVKKARLQRKEKEKDACVLRSPRVS
ncbi:hypothetical protein E2320_011542 [Naja naja]|nr:hypothetical protein E2320_011542 [Naja naja]